MAVWDEDEAISQLAEEHAEEDRIERRNKAIALSSIKTNAMLIKDPTAKQVIRQLIAFIEEELL